MPCADPGLSQATPSANRHRSGTIVLSSDFRVLFIDNSAIEFVEILQSDVSVSPPGRGLPPCLMDLAQEIAATDTPCEDKTVSRITPLSRVIGPPGREIQARIFWIEGQDGQDGRLVVILSHASHGPLA